MFTPRRITHRAIVRILIGGFALVIALLIGASVIGFRNLQGIEQMAARLVTEQNLTARLINEIQLEQATMNSLSFRLANDDQMSSGELLSELNQTETDFRRIVGEAEVTSERKLWMGLSDAVAAFTAQARLVMEKPDRPHDAVDELLRRHEKVLNQAQRLVKASSAKTASLKSQIEARSRRLANESLLLLGSCVILALMCAYLTVRTTTDSFHRMEWQASELSRVSWHLLENQEVTARRFSHELHDELGQSLAAVKANLSSLNAANWRERQADCLTLVDESIRNVRELSQLLRPVILDDFGLEAGLRWLAEKFTQRTGIRVDVQCRLDARLPDESETHLFRIAQEALTNVARHSGAKRVAIDLVEDDSKIVLSIRDDGKGMSNGSEEVGLGLVGMRARARHAGGEMTIDSKTGRGVTIDVWVPRSEVMNVAHQEDPHPVS